MGEKLNWLERPYGRSSVQAIEVSPHGRLKGVRMDHSHATKANQGPHRYVLAGPFVFFAFGLLQLSVFLISERRRHLLYPTPLQYISKI